MNPKPFCPNLQLSCGGVSSCSHSNINIGQSGYYVTSSSAAGTFSLGAYTTFGLYSSIIDSRLIESKFNFYGYYSGYNTTIYCGKYYATKCTINCWGNGCFGLIIMCENYCTVRCYDNAKSNEDNCPSIYTNKFNLETRTVSLNKNYSTKNNICLNNNYNRLQLQGM